MLMPAAVLIVLLLGAMAFDLSVVFLRQRQASSIAVDVANDVAGAALDEAAFRSDGRFRLDPDRADELFDGATDAFGRVDTVEGQGTSTLPAIVH